MSSTSSHSNTKNISCHSHSHNHSHNSNSDHDECMICLSSLLEGDNDDDDDDDSTYLESDSPPEVGAVWPCGHCFHIHCWKQWNKEKCPVCNQPASLFSKIFISAPPPKAVARGDLNDDERAELEQYRRMARQPQQQQGPTMLLRDMERQIQDDPQAAKAMMTMMMMVQARDMRKAERALEKCQDECEYTKDVLKVVQAELAHANQELSRLKPKTEQLQQEVQRLKQLEAASHRHEKDQKQIALLQEKLDRAKDKLALKNKQLSRRNKELKAKTKIINSHKLELITSTSTSSTAATKGEAARRAARRTQEELEHTKKRELELLKELDSFTMEDSSGSLRLSLIWE